MLANMYRLLTGMASRGGIGGKVQIFIFHRVLDEFDPLMPDEPDRERFEQMAVMIARVFNVIPLTEAIERLKRNVLPSRAACITFDDGYLDNYTNALPILRKYNLPATVFIATDYMNGDMMWNDIVIESVRSYAGTLRLDEIDIVDASCAGVEKKRKLLETLIPRIKHLTQAMRSELVGKVADQCGYRPERLMMHENEVAALRDAGITIGAHTCSHPILKVLGDATAEDEISRSRETLESVLKEKVSLFAYPNGRPGEDYTTRDVEIVKRLGFVAAVSTRKMVATARDSIYEIPRFTPWDTQPDKFIIRCILQTLKAQGNS